MDTDDNSTFEEPDLVRLLVLEVGRLMEDTSPDLAMVLPARGCERTARLAALRGITAALHSMMEAAFILDGINHIEIDAGR